MEQRTMGIVLSYYRKKYGLSLEELSEGICSVSTLFRLEQGYREIDSLLGETLLGRIGKEVTLFETMLNEDDYLLWQKRSEICNLIENGQLDDAENKIDVYEKEISCEENVHKQFCLYQRGRIAAERQQLSEMKALLVDAIRLTMPRIDRIEEQSLLFNSTEIEILLLLVHYKNYESDISEKLLHILLEHVNYYFSPEKKEQIEPKMYLELIECMSENAEKVVEYTTKGIEAIQKGKGYWYLAELYDKKARALYQCYSETAEWEAQEELCKECCVRAFFLYEVENDERKQKEISFFVRRS